MAKLSISISDDDLRWLEQRARRQHGGNLSAAITEQTRLMRHHEALGALLDGMGVPKLGAEEAEQVFAELDGRAPIKARAPKRGKRAA